MQETVKERLTDYLEQKGIGRNRFEASAGISSGYITKLKYAPKPEQLVKILQAAPDLNPDWLLTGKGSMFKSSTEEKKDTATMQENTMELPLIPIDAMAGALTGASQSFTEYDCERFIVPAFRGADFLIRIQGDSMMPRYLSGDIVACKRVPLDRLWFQWGKTYLIDTMQGALIKRIEPSDQEGCISIHSNNTIYKPFDLPICEINGVALVVGVIRVE